MSREEKKNAPPGCQLHIGLKRQPNPGSHVRRVIDSPCIYRITRSCSTSSPLPSLIEPAAPLHQPALLLLVDLVDVGEGPEAEPEAALEPALSIGEVSDVVDELLRRALRRR